jgi:outer membrane protein assembly factor BamB
MENNKITGFITKIKFFVLFIILVLLSPISNIVYGQDWPRFRGDVALSGHTLTKVPTSTPSNFLESQLGASSIQPLTADVDNDNLPEIIYLQQGRLIASSQDGTNLINKFFGITEIVSVNELDGDLSTPEIIAFDTFQRILLVINADGNLRWQYQFPEFVTLSSNYIKIADISPERFGKEIVLFPDHTKTQLDALGYFFSSQGTLYANPIVTQLFGGQLNFPQLAIADVDNDLLQEVVVVGRPRLMVFSGNGELKQQLDFREGDPEGRHYGLFTLADVNGDKTLEAIIIADSIPALAENNKMTAISVLQLTPVVKRLWGTAFPFSQTLRAPLKAVQDFDNDGKSEIVVNFWDGQEQQIRIYNGEGDPIVPGQAKLLTTIRNSYVWDIQDLNNDGIVELLSSLENVAVPSLTVNSLLKIYRPTTFNGNYSFLDSAQPITAMYLLNRTSFANESFNKIGSSDEARPKVSILETPLPRFLTYSSNATKGINFQERFILIDQVNGQEKLKLKTDLDIPRPGLIRAILSTTLNNEKFLVSQEVNGQTTGEIGIYQRMRKKLRILGTPLAVGSNLSSQVRVADLDVDRSNEIIIRGSGGKLLVITLDEINNTLTNIASFPGNFTPIIQALDGNNKNRPQIITTTNDNGRLRLSVYETRGTIEAKNLQVVERWGVTFSDISANTNVTITTGRFSGLSNRIDIFISTPRDRSIMLSGSDGAILWSRSDVFTFGNNPSVRDFNQDGRDDIYIVSDNLYRVLDGAVGRELVGPINVASFGGDFNSTPILSGNGDVLLVGPGTVVKITDKGTLLWNFAKTISGKVSQRQATNLLMGLAETNNTNGSIFDKIGGNFGESDTFYIYDYSNGFLSTKTPFQPITDIISLDLNNDGQDEFVFGTADGQIVALRAQDGSLVWSIRLESFPSDPVIAVVGKSRKTNLLFAPGNGTLRVYPLSAPTSETDLE